MKLQKLLPLLISLTTPLHAGVGDDLGFLGEINLGDIGRPKVTPRFETWGLETAQGLSKDLHQQGNLTLYQLDGSPIKLSTLWAEKPVLLVHGSLSCPISRDNCPHVDQILAKYGDRMNVVMLYTTEAHPIGSPSPYSEGGEHQWLTGRNIDDKVLVAQPKDLKARLAHASNYRDREKLKADLVVDNMANKVWKFFGAGSNTGILIAAGGKVMHRQGWLKPSLMDGAIRAHLAQKFRAEIKPKLKDTVLKNGHQKLTAPELEKIALTIPEVVHYKLLNNDAVNDQTLLHLAVSDLKIDLAEKLLALGASPNSQDLNGLTPLHYALRIDKPMKEKEPILTLLLNHGASDQVLTDHLESAMHFAVRSKSLEAVQLITEKGLSPDAKSIDGISPLHEALLQDDASIATHLISNKAALDIFASAARGDIININKLLVSKPLAWNSYQGNSQRSPLFYAATTGQTETVKFLLSLQTIEHRYAKEQLMNCLIEATTHQQFPVAVLIAKQAQDYTPPATPSSLNWSFLAPTISPSVINADLSDFTIFGVPEELKSTEKASESEAKRP